jgi:DNA-binding NarL/FixJ family response regulator
VRELAPDLVLMDIRMPRLDGLEATRRIVTAAPSTRVLVLTTFDADEIVYDALHARAAGFLLKSAPPKRLVEAVRLVNKGEALLAPAITRRLIEDHVQRPKPRQVPVDVEALTEREVLTLVARWLSNKCCNARSDPVLETDRRWEATLTVALE